MSLSLIQVHCAMTFSEYTLEIFQSKNILMSAQKDLDCTFFEKLSQFLQSQNKLYVSTMHGRKF